MAVNFSRLSVLVVEDNRAMKDLIVGVLEDIEVGRIFVAENGEQGFNVFCQQNPDIIIADWEMKPGDGIEMTQNIRRNQISPNRMVPIIMLTGYSAPKRVSTARDTGVTEFLAKPFTAENLINRIAYVINKPRDFIEAGNFFGPDRRRRIDPNFKGPYRRKVDKDEIDFQDTKSN